MIECCDKAILIKPNQAYYYCKKGSALNSLGQEVSALECFNQAFEISKSGNLGDYLSNAQINYINTTLSQEREDLIKKVAAKRED